MSNKRDEEMSKATVSEIRQAILEELPVDGTAVGNMALRDRLASRLGRPVDEGDYFHARDQLVAEGMVAKGQGRGGSVRRVLSGAPALTLQAPAVPEGANAPRPRQAGVPMPRKPGEPTRAPRKGADDPKVIAYRHDQKRKNNPDVGVVTPDNDPEQPRTRWAYDPHIDPALQFDIGRAQIEKLIDDALASGDEATMRAALEELKRQAEPYLNWAGKAERTSFEVDTVSLHVHERIDPATILAAVQKRMKQDKGEYASTGDMFRAWFEEPLPLREAVDFYRHERGWANRLIAGDSLLVMNSLLQKEGMAGQVQMIYIDPPYGIKYGSNFQPFVNKRDVKDRKDEDLTQEPEMIKAFRDTWELGIHSYLTYLRDRLLLARELLHESGSVFVQISDENLHHVREVMDEIFGSQNFRAIISYQTTAGKASAQLDSTFDFLVWYTRSDSFKFHSLYQGRTFEDDDNLRWIRWPDGRAERIADIVKMQFAIEHGGAVFRPNPITSQSGSATTTFTYALHGQSLRPSAGGWKTNEQGMECLRRSRRLMTVGSTLCFIRYLDDFPAKPLNNLWVDTKQSGFGDPKSYVVQTAAKVIERCLLMTTDPGDLVLDPTCGSGTTAYVAEKWGRRWITCDTSRVAITLAKQRLMTASYDYYELKYPHEGLKGGFIYKTVPHVTLKSIANNPEIDEIYARMHPAIEQALRELNAALRGAPPAQPFKVTEGGRKGFEVDFAAPESRTMTLPSGEVAPVGALLEWEVPFDFPGDWPASARRAFDAFHAARQAMQRKMDASIAAHADQEVLYDQPQVAKDKLRITGPFTVEAVPFPTVLALDEAQQPAEADLAIARSGESRRQHSWRDELLKTGIRGKGGQMLRFAELETLPDTRYLHCTGHLDSGERVVVSFGPEHAALEQRQVELAMREASDLFPRPKMIVFCAFAFDPEAAKDIDATKGIVALKVQMNTDLLTEDLKKARASNQSFWLMGQPDVEVRPLKDGRYVVEVNGFDYFDTVTGELRSGGKNKIAAWMLDTDYDERSLFPRQVFFPMAGAKDGWHKLKKDIKAELDESKLDKLHGTVSLPFEAGENRKIAVKIVDDRGIESLKVIPLDPLER
ncbi:site-specific DNA-methyltransferase [Vulcaniibacterium thermophilum]|uniref:site-specific DNA-methyltransferase (adenine-specific) n=1 Tax=Vulcaniibacterium thermophilum TaxID=1169913 RepID=A0A918YZD8_9GAMM|nr:site-specific DNA-methyltransferase [Vulcaniibacterium thermophilum]GHE30960.1 DNA methylase [Vulcaniibacterium thermophilum]